MGVESSEKLVADYFDFEADLNLPVGSSIAERSLLLRNAHAILVSIMSRITLLFTVVLFSWSGSLLADAKSDLTQFNSSIETAISTRDIAAIVPRLTEDFQFILRRGILLDKKGYLDALKAGQMLPDVHGEMPTIRIYGDTAVLTMKSSSSTAKEEWYTTRVFVKQGGGWKMALQQATLIMPHPR